MGIPGSTSIPKVAMVARPTSFAALDGTTHHEDDVDVVARVISMGNCHRAFALTAAMCLAVAARVEGTRGSGVHGVRARRRPPRPSLRRPAHRRLRQHA